SQVDQADHAMNFAMSGWGLVDWTYKLNVMTSPDLQSKCGKDLRKFRVWIRAECPEMEMAQTIGTVARHRSVDQYAPNTRETTASATTTPAGIPGSTWKIISDRGTGRNPVLEEMNKIISFWDSHPNIVGE